MPRRTPDEGVKPFEFRTGIGGLPSLGGMYRAGDPATIPPHKHHLLVNMRIRPGGMVTRPGMEEIHDTGVSECIEGVTEIGGAGTPSGAALALMPGMPMGGAHLRNNVTFRLIYPSAPSSNWADFYSPPPEVTYSEFLFVLWGPAATDNQTLSPVVVPGAYGIAPPTNFESSKAFIHNGMACMWFRLTDTEDPPLGTGDPNWVLLELPFSSRSFKHAHECLRAVDAWDPLPKPCPLESYEIGDTGFFRTNLWPGSYPLTTVRAIYWPQNPWPGYDWKPLHMPYALEKHVNIPERVDDPVTGEPGLAEALYFIASNTDLSSPDYGRMVLIKWNGVTQKTEYVIPANYTLATMGLQQYGPFLVGNKDTGGNDIGWNYFAQRGETGAWSVLPEGVEFHSPEVFTKSNIRAVAPYKGRARVVASGTWDDGSNNYKGVWVFEATDTHLHALTGVLWAGPPLTYAFDDFEEAIVSKNRIYALGPAVVDPEFSLEPIPGFISIPRNPAVTSIPVEERNIVSPGLMRAWPGGGAGYELNTSVWLVAVSGRVYAGGSFAPEEEVGYHAVYDITMPPNGYRNPVYLELLDEEDTVPPIPPSWEAELSGSHGCLESIPHEKVDEGFGSEGSIGTAS